MTTDDRIALWGNLAITHVWGAALYVNPGWFPAAMALSSLVLAAAIQFSGRRDGVGVA